MTHYKPVWTENGCEIRDKDGDDILISDTWPPRNPSDFDILLNHAEIDQPTRDLLKLFFGVIEPDDERKSDTE